jgi:sugar phosphate isomerase/epimerase
MSRMLALFTGPFVDLPLEAVCAKASEWGYQALDLACWGEHFAVQRAVSEPAYCRSILQLLEQHELQLVSLSNHLVGQAVADTLDHRHQESLPDWVWGDGDPEGVAARAAQEMIDTAKAAQQLGINLVVGCTGSPFTAMHFGVPAASSTVIEECWQFFTNRWKPILDAYASLGCRFACEIGPAQTAFDLYSTTATAERLEHHPAWSLALNPATLHWQGIDPVEFLRTHSASIAHLYIQDAAVALNGRSGLLGSLLPSGHPQRGWNARSPGMGNVDWASLVRGLHQVQYQGPLTVNFADADVDRDYGCAEAVHLLRRLEFTPVQREIGLFG